MQRETALVAAGVALLVAMVLAVLLVPGVGAEQREFTRPGVVELRSDAPPDVVDVAGDAVTLRIDTRVAHRDGPSENVSLEVRAVDGETGLLADRVVRDVGTLEDDREARVRTNLTIDREGSYRIETILYADGRRVASGTRTVSGVGSLTPVYARSPIRFQRYDGLGADLPTISYEIANASGGRTTLRVSAALTNTGSDPTGDVTLRLRARQAESNVIADDATVDVAGVRPGRTVTPGADLTVPEGYNYWLDATVVTDGVVVGAATAPANLDPQETLAENRTVRDVEFEAGAFERGDGDTGRPPAAGGPTEQAGPGFGVAVAVLAAAGAVVLARRGRNL